MKSIPSDNEILKAVTAAVDACRLANVQLDKVPEAANKIIQKQLDCTPEEASYYFNKYY